MKTLIAIISLSSSLVFASQDRGGGNIYCENKIREALINIREWIKAGNHRELDLKGRLTHDQYAQRMIETINRITNISCVSKGDPGHPVLLDGDPKFCIFTRNETGHKLTCDYELFRTYPVDEFYKNIHHEPAGLAGIENPKRSRSDYEISKQISFELQEFKVMMLPIVPKQKNKFDARRPGFLFVNAPVGPNYNYAGDYKTQIYASRCVNSNSISNASNVTECVLSGGLTKVQINSNRATPLVEGYYKLETFTNTSNQLFAVRAEKVTNVEVKALNYEDILKLLPNSALRPQNPCEFNFAILENFNHDANRMVRETSRRYELAQDIRLYRHSLTKANGLQFSYTAFTEEAEAWIKIAEATYKKNLDLDVYSPQGELLEIRKLTLNFPDEYSGMPRITWASLTSISAITTSMLFCKSGRDVVENTSILVFPGELLFKANAKKFPNRAEVPYTLLYPFTVR